MAKQLHSEAPTQPGRDPFGEVTRPIGPVQPGPGLRDGAVVVEMSGADAGRVHILTGTAMTIGRGAGCTLQIDDATLSRLHARVERVGLHWSIVDVESRNGTFVNHLRVTRHSLVHGDRIRLASGVRLQFQVTSADEAEVLIRLYEASVRDGLTGAYNRRHLQERLDSEVAYAARRHSEVCVLILDLDHFKAVNDNHGHLAGDEVLRAVVRLIMKLLRVEDFVARYGGEEFVVLARGIPLDGALALAERLRRAIANLEIPFDGKVLRVTVSVGAATYLGCQADPTVAHLLAQADAALYQAKEGGRNCVVAARPDPVRNG